MAFQTRYMTFAVHKEKPNESKFIEALPDLCIEKLVAGIEDVFKQSKEQDSNFTIVVIISDTKLLDQGGAKRVAALIKRLGGTVDHSFGQALRIKTQEGRFITMYQLGCPNPIAAAMVNSKPSLGALSQDLMDEAMSADYEDLPEVFDITFE